MAVPSCGQAGRGDRFCHRGGLCNNELRSECLGSIKGTWQGKKQESLFNDHGDMAYRANCLYRGDRGACGYHGFLQPHRHTYRGIIHSDRCVFRTLGKKEKTKKRKQRR